MTHLEIEIAATQEQLKSKSEQGYYGSLKRRRLSLTPSYYSAAVAPMVLRR